MISTILSPLADHLWQSTLFAAAVWLLTLTLRNNRASVRFGLWLAASIKFLVPFSLLVELGNRVEWRPAPSIALAVIPLAAEQIGQTFTAPLPLVAASPANSPLGVLLFSLWLCGFATSLFVWFRWYRHLRAAVRAATPLPLHLPIPVLTSPTRLEPGVFGIRKPVLLLPEGIASRLTEAQLQSILAHELCHVRRRDNLAAAVHMFVESVFWFHPLVWWIGARLVDERERACDEAVVRLGNEPHVYAEGILNVCKFYLQSPLPCASGVTGADLRKRIDAIVSCRISSKLSAGRKLLLAASGILAVAGPILIGILNAPSGRAQSKEKLVFEVASIKRIDPGAQTGGRLPLAPGVTDGGGIRSHVPIFNLICWAYRIDGSQLSGGPSWIRSDRYAIEAQPEKVEGPQDPEARLSQQERDARTRERVKALLADRFQLAVRTETKEASVYVLSVAKGGPRLTLDPEGKGGIRNSNDYIESFGAPISFLAVSLTHILGRPVKDETSIEGRFKYKLEFRPEDVENDPRPSIFTALKSQLGLELHSRKGPVTSIAIERIERPTEN